MTRVLVVDDAKLDRLLAEALLNGAGSFDVESVDSAAEALRALGVGTAIITLGERGAYLQTEGRSVHAPAFDAGPVVETTGAGDAFNGGFATALAAGADPVAAMRFGCAAAAISVTRPGTAPSMPTRAEVEKLLG